MQSSTVFRCFFLQKRNFLTGFKTFKSKVFNKKYKRFVQFFSPKFLVCCSTMVFGLLPLNTVLAASNFWDGSNPALWNNGVVNGGDGTWSLSGTNLSWTSAPGVTNTVYSPGGLPAMFRTLGGTVTVDNSSGQISAVGMQFSVDGYTLVGNTPADTLALSNSGITVSTGTANINLPLTSTVGLSKLGAGTVVLGAVNTYTGGTSISQGILRAGIANAFPNNTAYTLSGGTLDLNGQALTMSSLSGGLNLGTVALGGATLIVNQSSPLVGYGGAITGTGSFTKQGTGLLLLEGTNTYSGTTTVSAGTLQAGGSSAFPNNQVYVVNGILDLNGFSLTMSNFSGNGTVDLTSAAVLTVDQASDTIFSGGITSSGSLIKSGAGTLILAGSSNYTGTTAVNGGTLNITDLVTGLSNTNVTVASTGILSGANGTTVGQTVTVNSGGQLEGQGGTTVNMTSLALNNSSFLLINSLTTPSTTPLFNVTDDLTLAGASIAFTPSAPTTAGLYRLIDYGTTLTGTDISVANPNLYIQTQVPGQINLINTTGLVFNYWDGSDATLFNNGVVDGGNGTWSVSTGNASWTTSTGAVNAPYNPAGLAPVFMTTGGTVTVDDTAGQVSAAGLQFSVGGYTLVGNTGTDTLALSAPTIETDAGTTNINLPLTGTVGLTKTGAGSLVLGAANTYSGTTTVSAGTLQAGASSAFPNNQAYVVNGGTLDLNGNALSMSNFSGSGGAVALTAGAALTVNQTGTTSYNGNIGSTGSLTKSNTGTLTLGGTNDYSGGTLLSGGVLQMGSAAGLPANTAYTINGGQLQLLDHNLSMSSLSGSGGTINIGTSAATTLTVDQASDTLFSGVITSNGSLVKSGAGTLILAGSNNYTGTTAVNGGTLDITNLVTGLSNTNVTVASTGILIGANGATVGHTVTVNSGGQLEGVGGGTVNMTSLALNSSSSLLINSLTTPSTTPLFNVTADLTLAGASIAFTPSAPTTAGLYRLIDYGTTLTGTNISVANPNLYIQTQVPGQINLINTTGLVFNYWDGGNPALFNNGVVDGGNGTWSVSTGNANWTPSTGSVNAPYNPGGLAAVFTNPGPVTGGTVAVDNTAGQVSTAGLQFLVSGYTLMGNTGTDTLALSAPTIETDAGTTAINLPLTGSAGLTKTNSGVLVLGAVNTYTGTTEVDAGTLRAGVAGALISGDYIVDGTLELNNFPLTMTAFSGSGSVNLGSALLTVNQASDQIFLGQIIGTGGLTKTGVGQLILSGNSGYSGTTTLTAGTLEAGSATGLPNNTAYIVNGGTLRLFSDVGPTSLSMSSLNGLGGTINLPTDGTTLTVNQNAPGSYAGTITGSGNLIKDGTDLLVIHGGSYTGTTTVSNGSLRITSGLPNSDVTVASNGSLSGGNNITIGNDVVVNGTLLGQGGQTVDMTNLTLNNGSTLLIDNLTIPSPTPLFNATTDLVLAGASLAFEVATPTTPGLYRLINYGGTLSGTAISLAVANPDLYIQTQVNNQINLINTHGVALNYWDGNGPYNNDVIDGGSGTWSLDSNNISWTNAAGSGLLAGAINAPYKPQGLAAVFMTTGGTVTVDNTAGQVSTAGLQFSVGGYTLVGNTTGDTLALSNPTIQTDTGTTNINLPLTGSVGLTKTGAGTLVLGAVNTYTGTTEVDAGILRAGVANALVSGAYIVDATLDLNNFPLTMTSFSGSVTGAVTLGSGLLTVNQSSNQTFSGQISGSGGLTKQGPGTLNLAGNNALYTGTTNVNGGTLNINTSMGGIGNSNVQVNAGGVLTGIDQAPIGNTVTINVNGDLIGTQGQTLLMNALVFESGSFLDVTLGAPGTTALFSVDGDLTLDGTLTVNPDVGFGPGIYRLIDYTGTLTDNGMQTEPDLFINTATAGQVNLINATGASFNFWDGSNTTPNDQVDGGSGTWSLQPANTNWTLADGSANNTYNVSNGIAIFTSNPGIVTIDNSFGPITTVGMQFAIDGYRIQGDPLTLANSPQTTIRVGDGTLAGAGFTATIASVITDNGAGLGLTKTDLGTLVLAAANTYTGGTIVNAGTLRAAVAGAFVNNTVYAVNATSTNQGVLDLNGFDLTMSGLTGANGVIDLGAAQLTVNQAGTTAFTGTIQGSGSLVKDGVGSLTLNTSLSFPTPNSYTGGTTVLNGVLQAGDAQAFVSNTPYTVQGGVLDLNQFDLSMSSLSGSGGTIDISGGAVLAIVQNIDTSFGGVIDGGGTLIKDGNGVLTLTGANTYTLGTVVNNGILRAGSANAFVQDTAYTVNAGTLDLNSNDLTTSLFAGTGGTVSLGSAVLTLDQSVADSTYAGTITGSGSLVKTGTSTVGLNGVNAYTGGTTVNQGTLIANVAGAFVNNTAYTVNGGVLNLGSHDLTISSLAGTGGNIDINNAILTVNTNATSSYGGAIINNGQLVKMGAGALVLSGVNTYTGQTTVNEGLLSIDGATGGTIGSSNVLVNLNGALAGINNAIIGNAVTVNGTLFGAFNEVAHMNSLEFGATGILNVILDAPSSQALFVVANNLTLDGSLVVTAAGPGFGPGVYRLIDYSGSLIDQGLATSSPDFYISTQIPGQVNLVNTIGVALNYWDGNGPYFNNQIDGGSGTWSLDQANISWTNAATGSLAAGALNAPYKPEGLPAVFTTTGGLVTIDNSAGNVSAAGLQFLANGYQMTGDSLTLTAPGVLVDGSATANISSSLTGTVGLTKTGTGTLILAGVNSYTGTTTVTDGVLGAAVAGAFINNSPYVVNGGMLALNGFDLTMSSLSGLGGSVNMGTANLTVDQADNTTYAGSMAGTGVFTKAGTGTLTLSGVNTYTGKTMVNAGTLAIDGATGGTIGSSNVLVNSGGTLTGINNATIGNAVTVNGTLLGQANQVANMNSLAFGATGILNVTLDAPSSQALFVVAGNLTLDGNLVVTQGPGFGPGVYRLIDYAGNLVDQGLTTNVPDFYILTQIPGQVSLVNTTGVALNYWDGNGPYFNDQIDGGSGTWSLNNTNISWTNAATGSLAAGALNGTYKPAGLPAVFTTIGGLVTVDNSGGNVSAAGLQFLVDGYQITGDSLALTAPEVLVDGSATATISSSLTGTVGLTKTGTGTLLLAGVNAYSGTTTLTDGVLGAGAAGGLINNAPYVVNGGVLALNGFDLTMSSLSGLGGSVNMGTANLTVDQANNTTYAGSVAGTGVFTKAGAGTLILTGDSSGFGGSTNLNAGGLTVNGQLGGNLVVAAGTLLKGNGTIGGNLTVDGTIAPGNSIGTITVGGNYIQNSGSTYEVEINPAGASDLILVDGSATLNGGTVDVIAAAGTYALSTRYTILTANGGVTGTYSSLTSPLDQPFLQLVLAYDTDHVYLDVTRSQVTFPEVGNTQNQRNTGAGVESLGSGNPIFDAVVNLATAEEARRAFDSLSGEIHVTALSVFIEDSVFLRDAVMDRLAQVFGPERVMETAAGDGGLQPMVAVLPEWGVWAQGFGSWGRFDGNGNASTVDRSIGGAFLGVDRQFGDYIRLGLLGGYSQSDFNVGDVRDSRGISDNYSLALYGGAQWEQLRIRAGGAYTWHDLDVTRNVVFPGFVNTLTSSYGARTAQAFAEAGYELTWWGMGLEPFIGAAYVNVDTKRWTEQGGAAALTGKGQEDVFYTTLGIRQAAALFERGGLTIGENVLLGWRHACNDVTPESTLAFATGSIPFVIGGVPVAQNTLIIDAGLDFGKPANNLNFKVSYIGQVGSDIQDHGVMGVLSWRF